MSVETFDQSYPPSLWDGGGEPVVPSITSPVDGATVPPVHDVTGTARPGQTVTLWSAMNDGTLAEHASTRANASGVFTFDGTQASGRDGDLATFEVRSSTGTSDQVVVTVAGPVLDLIEPDDVAADTPTTYTITGERLNTLGDVLRVRTQDTDDTVTRLVPDTVTATSITFDATFTGDGAALVSLGDGDTGPELTDRLAVGVTSA